MKFVHPESMESELELEGPSKSQRKRDAHKLQDLGTRLTGCSEAQLRALELPEKTIAAFAEYNRLPNSHGARRRQMQFIGKLMRKFDLEELTAALDRLEKIETHRPKPVPQSKQWVVDILQNGDVEINALVDSFPQLERQKLRQFYRDYHAAEGASQERVRAKLNSYLQPVVDR